MKICHVCSAVCEDDAQLCPVCGAEFLEKSEDSDADEARDITIDNPVLAASVEDVVTAEIFCDMLDENGIPHSSDEPQDRAGVKLLFGGGFATIDIYVDEKDLKRAQDIYDQVINSEPDFEDFFDDGTSEP